MKRFLPATLAALLACQGGLAQRDQPGNFLEAAKKDSGYARFQAALSSLINKAKGRNTYASEAKALIDQHKSMLDRVNRQYNRSAAMSHLVPLKARPLKIDPALTKWSAKLSLLNPSKPFPTPYQGWIYVELANASTATLEQNDLQNGELAFSILPSTLWSPSLKEFHCGFRAAATVPEDPSIIAARVEFEYSFYYTGWDTYGANNGIQLVLGPSKTFNSPVLKASTDTAEFMPGYNGSLGRVNIMEVLLPPVLVSGEFAEVHADQTGTISVEGYVKPNEMLSFSIGAGYIPGSVYGINGHYLYGEFRLKKARITYLKTLSN